MTGPTRILLIEDDAGDRLLIDRCIRAGLGGFYCLDVAERLSEVAGGGREAAPDVVLLDLGLPDSRGAATLRDAHRLLPDVPIVVLTGSGDDRLGLEMVAEGAQDFLVKGDIEPRLLARALRYAMARGRRLTQAEHAATHDALTGLPNRALLMDRVTSSLDRARRRGESLCLAFFDFDGFKPVNDTHGHAVGDELLRQIAERFRQAMRRSDSIARWGGDEFAAIFESLGSDADARAAARKVAARLCEPYSLALTAGEVVVALGVSVGLSLFPQHAGNANSLLMMADMAMYQAKAAGGRCCVVYGAPDLPLH